MQKRVFDNSGIEDCLKDSKKGGGGGGIVEDEQRGNT